MHCGASFSYQRPNVVSHHCTIPAAFKSSFHWLNILVKSLTMLLTEVTKIFLKEIQMRAQKVKFYTHATTHVLVTFNKLFHKLFVIWILFISQKSINHNSKCLPRIFLCFIHFFFQGFRLSHGVYLGTNKYSAFYFSL